MQAVIWDYYKPRHTHAWNMLVLSWLALETLADEDVEAFEDEYLWENGLKAIRDMIEHFDDYAAGKGRGPATRGGKLDPWRTVTRDRFECGRFVIDRASAYDAAIRLRTDAKRVSDAFIVWYKASR